MSAAVDAKPAQRARALLIGRSPVVMESVLAELRALGVEAVGDVDPAHAADRPDAGAYEVVAIGRGVTGALRARLRERLLVRNPRVKLMDVTLHESAARVAGALGDGDPEAVDLAAYLARISYAGPIGQNVDALRGLITAHLAAIPFENIDVLTGRGVDISAQAVDAKLIGARRGGYCYEQNGLLRRALAALGFEVDALMARVVMNQPPGRPLGRSHMTLKVTIGDVAHLVDVGFGGFTPPAPLALDDEGPQATPHERYRIVPFGPLKRLEVETQGAWAPLYEFSNEAQLSVDYEGANWFTSTHPSSFFTRALVAARTTPDARLALYGNRLTVRPPGAPIERRELDAAEIERTLEEAFGLAVAPDWRPVINRAAEAP
ncbi:arylamine N-acetyltransferase [Methylopila sp. M107]|uniref:arylamine N-acetyltransferase family protein n=1 Tax=Methylopila sp. M107 TaxID=1101190 RepID=UPI000364E30F|nr:arylamine N-acetyltransferase [Methylopila sp. M107]